MTRGVSQGSPAEQNQQEIQTDRQAGRQQGGTHSHMQGQGISAEWAGRRADDTATVQGQRAEVTEALAL